jgi:hypothetical protein
MTTQNTSPWVYSAYPSDTPVSDFGLLSNFVDIWRKKSPGAGKFPCWRDFELMDFEGWWGQVSLAEIQDDPFDFRWTLWGTKMTEWWGVDYTNKLIGEIPEVEDVWNNYEKPYIQRIVNERLIGHVTGTLSPQNREHQYICGVDLPLEQDGRVTHFMSAYHLCDPNLLETPSSQSIFCIGTPG